MKRILIVTQYIYPEPFKSTEMAFELAKRGYKVDVLTGIPNYPEGHYYDGYGLFSKRYEVVNDVTFYRCLQTPRKLLPGFIGLSLNYLSFAFNATLWVLFYFFWKKKYFAIITHEPSPITQIIPACILGDLRKTPVYSWIQDIWPDSVTSAIGGKGKIIKFPLQITTEWIYRHSTKLLISSKGMSDLINRNNDYTNKIVYFPQWSSDILIPIQINDCRNQPYTIMMVGTLNSGIGVDALMSLCTEMRNDDVVFTLVGGGSEERIIRDFVKTNKLDKVYLTGRRPSSEMPVFYSKADAMLLTLRKSETPHLKATVPARLQGYMSAGKPILAMVDGDSAELIKEADCGYYVSAGCYKELADYIRDNVLTDKNAFSKKGENARKFFLENFTREMCVENLIKIIENK